MLIDGKTILARRKVGHDKVLAVCETHDKKIVVRIVRDGWNQDLQFTRDEALYLRTVLKEAGL